jgi:hypothetical protein
MPSAFSARTYALVAILPALSLAAACTTMRLEDTVPATTAAATAPADAAAVAPAASYAPDDPALSAPPPRPTTRGGFPNLNIRPETAGEQLTATERLQKTRELEAARQRVNQEADAPRIQNGEQLRRTAREREEEALRRIEGR